MNIIEQIKELKEQMGAGFATLNIETPDSMITITIEDKEKKQSEEKHNADYAGIPTNVNEVIKRVAKKDAEESEHLALCAKCGKPFIRKGKERTCPECKKQAHREATARYEAKKKVEKTAREIIDLGND